MKTITAKELRDNLDQIVQRVRTGETIKVTYRSKPAFILQPEHLIKTSIEQGSQAAMEQFFNETIKLNNSKKELFLDSNKSSKVLYHEMLDNDKKYSYKSKN